MTEHGIVADGFFQCLFLPSNCLRLPPPHPLRRRRVMWAIRSSVYRTLSVFYGLFLAADEARTYVREPANASAKAVWPDLCWSLEGHTPGLVLTSGVKVTESGVDFTLVCSTFCQPNVKAPPSLESSGLCALLEKTTGVSILADPAAYLVDWWVQVHGLGLQVSKATRDEMGHDFGPNTQKKICVAQTSAK